MKCILKFFFAFCFVKFFQVIYVIEMFVEKQKQLKVRYERNIVL
jgi:hypothetical protein